MALADRAKPFGAKRKRKPPKRKTKFVGFVIPEGFELVIDTREQKPLFAGKRKQFKDLKMVHRKLEHGDYSFIGGEDIIAIERKYKGDLYTYIFNHHKTVKKLRAMKDLKFKSLVVEDSEESIYNVKDSFTEHMTIEQIRGFLSSINIKHNMHVYCNKDRENIERWILDRLILMYNFMNIGKSKDENNKNSDGV